MFENSLLIFCFQECSNHHLSQQVCAGIGGQSLRYSNVLQQSTKKRVQWWTKAFSYQCLSLLFLCPGGCCPEEAQRSWIMPSSYQHMLPFWYGTAVACARLVGDTPQLRGRSLPSCLLHAAPLASWWFGGPWPQVSSSSLTPARSRHPTLASVGWFLPLLP